MGRRLPGDRTSNEIAKIYIIGGQNEITRRNKKNKRRKKKELDLRVNLKANTREKHILVCHGTGCTSSKSPKIIENFRKIIDEKGIKNVRVIQNWLLWTMRKRTNSYNKARGYFLCYGKTRRL